MASVSALPPVPHTNVTGHGKQSAGQERHEHGLPGLQSATLLSISGDSALHTRGLEARTRPAGDRHGSSANPTIGQKESQTHSDHRHPPRGTVTDRNPSTARNPDQEPKWLFTTTPSPPCRDPTWIAIRCTMHEPGRTGKQKNHYYQRHNSCYTPEYLTQTIRCQRVNPDTAYMLRYIYSYLTQGQQEQGLIAVSPRTKGIISKRIGVYATPILQHTTRWPTSQRASPYRPTCP